MIEEDPEASYAPLLRAMRDQCHTFIEEAPLPTDDPRDREFFRFRLGAFRSIMGVYLAILARAFKVNVPPGLRSLLPALD